MASILEEPSDVVPGYRMKSPAIYSEFRQGQDPGNKDRLFPAEVLTAGEVHSLIGACSRRGPSGLRNRALLVVLWRGGLRVSEAAALLPKDVDFDNGVVTVLRGKGAKRRAVGLDPQALAVLQVWVNARARLAQRLPGITNSAPLFCTISVDRHGGPLKTAYIRNMMKRLREKAGIEKRVHPHGLRHTHAFELSVEGVGLNVIQKQLGHKSLATTARYIDHLAPRDVIEAMQRRTWAEAG